MPLLQINKILSELKGFDWNKGNVDKNLIKHEVSVKECEEAFFNEPIVFFKDEKHSKKEKRYGIFGRTNSNRKLTIIFTIRNKKIRVISARGQSKKERRKYDKKEN
ncbi:BrnT family toxin [Patescibacteria group bacterium]|nr:BrnT family toxin [Patescibacteria group bacterium]